VARRGGAVTAGPRVSVVVLGAATADDALRRSLDDALAQRDVELEILLPGDAGAAGDGRVVALDAPAAAPAAVVVAAALAAGCAPWVAFLAAGDRWHPEHVRRGLAAIAARAADWSYASRVLLDRAGGVRGLALAERPEQVAAALRHRDAVGGPSSVLCRTAVLAQDRPFESGLRGDPYRPAWQVLARRPAAACPEVLVAEAGAAPAGPAAYAAPRWMTDPPAPAAARRARAGDRPEVSVIVPTRNRPAFLRQAVASALGQEVALEVLVVDDASDRPDALAALDFADPRVRVQRRSEPGGAGRARNDALGVARGRWVAFLDDDDLMAPGRLATHLEHAGDAGFSFCGQLVVDPARRILGALPAPAPERLAGRLRVGSLIGGPSAVVAGAELTREAGGFREDLHALGDWDLWLGLAARAEAVALPELLVAYTRHPDNMHLRDPQRILEDFRRFDALHRVGAPAHAALLAWLAEELAAAGRHRAAAAMQLRLARLRRRPADAARAARAAVRRAPAAAAADLEPWPWLAAYRDAGELA
jgi:hypothetical protein